jgi:hypothetical protein
MRFRFTLPIAVLALALLAPAAAPAKSRYKVGIGEQNASVFSEPLFQALKLKRIRYVVPWNWNSAAHQREETTHFLETAHANGYEPFVAFTARRGCWNGKRYSKKKACRAPSTKAYAKKVRAFRKAFPFVRVFSPWNEVNHMSQPTYKSPKRAAAYYNTFRRYCTKRCTLVAADLLDSSNLTSYLRKFQRHAKGKPRVWGLHNYSDVNRRRDKVTKQMLRIAPGQVWLTETGGLVSFTKRWPYSPNRAKSRVSYMFKLADRYSHKRRGFKSRITRIYPYQYTGVKRGTSFDAGLVHANGKPRPAYKLFKSKARTRSK